MCDVDKIASTIFLIASHTRRQRRRRWGVQASSRRSMFVSTTLSPWGVWVLLWRFSCVCVCVCGLCALERRWQCVTDFIWIVGLILCNATMDNWMQILWLAMMRRRRRWWWRYDDECNKCLNNDICVLFWRLCDLWDTRFMCYILCWGIGYSPTCSIWMSLKCVWKAV